MENKDDLKNANIIVDCDEILVNISPKWCRKILEDRDYYRPYFNIEILEKVEEDKEKFDNLVYNRPHFYLNKWLIRENVEVPSEVYKKFLSIHAEKDFYYDLELTKMAVGLKQLALHPSIDNIYAITRHVEGTDSIDSKISLINSLFPSNKLKICLVKPGENKSDYVKELNMENGFIFEDELPNIKDYLENTNIKNCFLYLPKFGYNVPNGELIDLIIERNIIFKVY